MTAVLRRTAILGTFGVLTVTGAAQGPPLPSVPDQNVPIVQELLTTRQFNTNVDDYVALHRLLEGSLPAMRPTTNMLELRRNMRVLATRIQRARQDAQQGDIITPDVARMFKRRIAQTLSPEAWDALFAELAADRDDVPLPPLRVNMEWPAEMTVDFVPPQLLMALPRLPPELQYRIIGRALVLWDHHADLIVDFLPGAFTT
jgi:hypothetical protein